eukprot:scaffold254236_cov18-Prasinocladus_malaysianus.AAC.2
MIAASQRKSIVNTMGCGHEGHVVREIKTGNIKHTNVIMILVAEQPPPYDSIIGHYSGHGMLSCRSSLPQGD